MATTQVGQMRPRIRPSRGASSQPKQPYSTYSVNSDEWTGVPVPAIVESAVFEAVQEQLSENQRRARTGARGARYLLQGLVTCKLCGYAYYGKAISNRAAFGIASQLCLLSRSLARMPIALVGSGCVAIPKCGLIYWKKPCGKKCARYLRIPKGSRCEYHRRGQEPASALQENLTNLSAQITKLRRGIGRLIDSYAEGLIEKGEFEPRITRLQERVAALVAQVKQLNDEATLHRELRLIIGQLSEFAQKVSNGLDQVGWNTQREIIRTLVKRVEVDSQQVNVVFRVGSVADAPHLDANILPDCGRGNKSITSKHWTARVRTIH